jgi:protein Mpv17
MAMMLKFWNWYQNSLSVHPVKTQVTTSGILWAVGDVTAQYITHSAAAAASSAKKRLQLSVTVSNNNNYHSQPTPFVLCCPLSKNSYLSSQEEADAKFVIDWRRVAVTSMFGLGFVGPVGHFWY